MKRYLSSALERSILDDEALTNGKLMFNDVEFNYQSFTQVFPILLDCHDET